jgi:hypothetical protein
MGDLLHFPGGTTLPLPVARVLEAAHGCTEVLVLGWDAEGQLYAASTTGDGGTLLWWLELFKHKLLAGDYASG